MLRFRFLFESFLREGEGGGGGAAPVQSGQITPAAPPTPALAPEPSPDPAPAPAAWKMPDGVPDHLKADDAVGFAAKVFDDWGKQRNANRDMGAKYAPPADVKGYEYKPSDKAAPFVGDQTKDPVFTVARDAALKAGMPSKMFGEFIGGLYDQLADAGALKPPYDASKARRDFLGDAAKTMDDKATLDAVAPIMTGLETFIDGLKNQKVLGEGQDEALKELLDTPNGMKALQSLQSVLASKGITPGGVAPAGAAEAAAAFDARRLDPRNDFNSGKYDKKFADETHEMSKRMFGLT
jgi:hypothetical protein